MDVRRPQILSPCPECGEVPFTGGSPSEGRFRVFCSGGSPGVPHLKAPLRPTADEAGEAWEEMVMRMAQPKESEPS